MSFSETCETCGPARHVDPNNCPPLHPSDPVLADCPDFRLLAPPLKTRVLSLKRGRGRKEREGEEEEEDEDGELRMCSNCQRLIHR